MVMLGISGAYLWRTSRASARRVKVSKRRHLGGFRRSTVRACHRRSNSATMTNKPPPTAYPRLQTRSHGILEDVDDATVMSLEDRLWWEVGRKAILKTFLDWAVATRPVRRIFEIGCGNGNNFDLLSKYGRVIACDASPVQVRRARARNRSGGYPHRELFSAYILGAVPIDLFF